MKHLTEELKSKLGVNSRMAAGLKAADSGSGVAAGVFAGGSRSALDIHGAKVGHYS